jgi:transcription initiation factor TFIIIB Brf1 subunit/transcription initiation factor TFIIB
VIQVSDLAKAVRQRAILGRVHQRTLAKVLLAQKTIQKVQVPLKISAKVQAVQARIIQKALQYRVAHYKTNIVLKIQVAHHLTGVMF